jgi:chorismate dehydratase
MKILKRKKMKTKKIKVSAVSYLNTLPFLFGINNSEIINEIDLSLDIPSDCAKKLLNGEVDLGLVPVAILPNLKEYHIISDYCIGAEGRVESVALFSDVPLNEIENIYLDYQSKTSVTLVKLLAAKSWKITPKWTNTTKGYENEIEGKNAGVIIGDRTFNLSKSYKYKYDLAEEWFKLTKLPFAFACWVSNKELPESFIQNFNKALKEGVNNINKVVLDYNDDKISKEDLQKYLSNNISYLLDARKEEAIQKFLKFLETRKVLSSEY